MRRQANYSGFIWAFLIIAVLALVFFLASFGPVFYRALTNPNPPHTDNGLGMAYVLFVPPLGLTLLLILACIYYLFLAKGKLNKSGFIGISILAFLVAVFGFLMLLACGFAIVRFFALQA